MSQLKETALRSAGEALGFVSGAVVALVSVCIAKKLWTEKEEHNRSSSERQL